MSDPVIESRVGFLQSPPGRPDLPSMVINQWVGIPCGCGVYIGIRMDKLEPATAAMPCTDEHLPMINVFNDLLVQSTRNPADMELAEVISLLLGKVSDDHDL